MLIPVNIKLKHWILACINFEQKWIAWFDSIDDTYEQETRLLFTWLTREHSINNLSVFEPAEWSIHSGPPPNIQAPLQSNDYDCGIFICLYAAYLDLRLPLSFSQHDTQNVRAWMAHEMIEEGKLANEKQKNIQAAAEFWADMRKTHGFLNQAAGLKVQVAAMTEEAVRKPGSSSKQQVEAPFENRENPKRRKRSDDEYKHPTIHSLDTTTKQTKSNTAPPCEYTKPVTMTISLGNTPTSGGEDETLLTVSETRTTQALDAIPVEPVKRTGDDADKFAEPTTTTAPKRDNLGTASLTAIEDESHNPQTQTGSTDEVWLSHSNRKRDKIPHSPTPGTYSKQQVHTSIENLGNRKRKGGSDDELQHPSTLLLDTTIPRPVKRNRFLTGEYVKSTTMSSRNAVPLTTHETEKSALTDVPLSPVTRVTHGFHPRAAGTHDGGSPTDVNQKSHQRQTSTTTPPRQAINNDIVHRNSTTYSVLVGTDTIALAPIQGNSTTSPRKKRDRHKHKLHSVSYTQSRLRNR
jgi:hypothetical protein